MTNPISFTLIPPGGDVIELQGQEGHSVMQTAVARGIKGIVGECGGSAMCATCHVYVDDAWRNRLEPLLATEEEMLECTSSERRPESRLSCQIRLTGSWTGWCCGCPKPTSSR